MFINEIRDFIFENYYTRIRFSKENSYYSMKCLKKKFIEKIPDPRNDKELYQLFLRKKNRSNEETFKKQSQIITYQVKKNGNTNTVDIKSVITKHPKFWHKLSKTIGKNEKVDSNRSLYSDTKNKE